ncbi:glycerol-3-phosphate acyltransferase PlsX [Dyadobacter jejuensis]|uniref:Phosphate acyltransferase n=1 Tax=Dyadobacter jejuensis TaxID=1082580 RepID=A0A316ARD3_9BACT|nr:phosphate acyltransferase PlsX [Dyadobacter jejuensis]PWJ60068.1 glycerol-3-phosphate acyltransferase PlsX [Dyadobacter jejuensis]
MKIAVDAMGGDLAPQAIIEGAIQAATELPSDAKIILIGNENIIKDVFKGYGDVPSCIDIVHAEDVIKMGEHPTKALSQKPNSSIAIGFKLLKEKEVDIFCGAGNTGAMHVGALFSIKAIEGVLRPAIAGFVPQLGGGHAIMMDIGANADCKPEVLAQFGELGSLFAQYTFQLSKPRVALMNIGEEEQKGSLTAQATYPLLEQNKKINFIGNIEGKDLFTNKADVIVTDGFTGNILFKMGESLYEIAKKRGIKDDFIDQTNYEAIGGSPIVGVNGNVMIAHGVSTPLAIQNMIGWAYKQVKSKAFLHIAQALN